MFIGLVSRINRLRVQCTTDQAATDKPSKRFTHTEEAKRRMSEKKKGYVMSEEHRKAISEAKKGNKLSLAHRYKISSAMKGRELTAEHRQKLGNAVSATKQRLRRNRLGEFAAAAASAATKDLLPVFSQFEDGGSTDSDGYTSATDDDEEESMFGAVVDHTVVLNDWGMKEKAVIEMVALRDKLSKWMADYEQRKYF